MSPPIAAPTPDLRRLFDLTGRVALVTGASKGIGAAMARGLAAHGARVVVSSRDQGAVDAVAAAIRDEGGDALGVACHVGRAEDRAALVAATVAHYGGLDVLINNAATNPVYGPVQEADARAFEKIMEVNVQGPLDLCRQAYPHLKAGRGAVINVSSVNGLKPQAGTGLYGVSKAALLNLTRALAGEWGPNGIRVNAIVPGLIQTKFSEALWTDDRLMRTVETALPLRRIGQPEELAGLAVFLASAASSYCTGGVYLADGGHLLV